MKLRQANTKHTTSNIIKIKNKVLDTSTLYRRTLLSTRILEKKEQYTLDELADKFSISKADRHTAVGDSYITAIAFLKIIDKLKPKRLKHLFVRN